ncbi:MAG TPA: hypothetical protein VEU33_25905, partial [Archangium sp.]|nr:hypothetical protein [Archangium sp.]
YLLHYYGAHLEREGRGVEELLSLVGEGWLRAVESRERTYAGFLRDVDRAQQALQRDNHARLSGGKAPAIADEVRCGLVRSSIHLLAKNLSPAQLRAFLSTRWWTLEEAHFYARNIPEDSKRLDALLVLADGAPESKQDTYLREALELARSMEVKREVIHVEDPLERICSHVSTAVLPSFVQMLELLEDVESRVRCLVALAKHQPASRRPPLLDRARALLGAIQKEGVREQLEGEIARVAGWERTQERERRRWSLVSSGRGFRTSEDFTCLEELASETPSRYSERDHEHVLAMAWKKPEPGDLEEERLSRFDEPQLKRLLECARGFTLMEAQAYLLVTLAPRLPAQLLPDAWLIAQDLEESSIRAEVLAALAPRMPEPERKQVLEEMTEAVFELSDAEQLLPVAAGLAGLLSEPRRTQVLRRVWDARELARGPARSYTLASVIRFLPEEMRRDALKEALRAAISGDELFLDADVLLSHLGSALASPSVRQLLRELEFRVSFEGIPFKILAEIAPFVPDEWIDGMWKAKGRDEGPDQVVSYFHALGPRFTPEFQRAVLDRLSAEEVNEAWRALVVAGLAPHLDASLVSRALGLVSECRQHFQIMAFAQLWPRLADNIRAPLLVKAVDRSRELAGAFGDGAVLSLARPLAEVLGEKAIDFVEEIRLVGSRVEFLVSLVEYLPPFRERLIREAIEWAAQDLDAYSARMMVDVVAHAPESVLPELLAVAKGLKEDDYRAVALGAVASRLPPEQRYEVLAEAVRHSIPGGRGPFWHDGLPGLRKEVSRLPRNQLYSLWEEALPRLAAQARPEFLQQLQVLGPALLALGEEEEMERIVRALLEVGRWWD